MSGRMEEIEARLAAWGAQYDDSVLQDEARASLISHAPRDIAYLLERVAELEATTASTDDWCGLVGLVRQQRNDVEEDAAEGRRLVREWRGCGTHDVPAAELELMLWAMDGR